jgi:hypothetical protein
MHLRLLLLKAKLQNNNFSLRLVLGSPRYVAHVSIVLAIFLNQQLLIQKAIGNIQRRLNFSFPVHSRNRRLKLRFYPNYQSFQRKHSRYHQVYSNRLYSLGTKHMQHLVRRLGFMQHMAIIRASPRLLQERLCSSKLCLARATDELSRSSILPSTSLRWVD